MTTFYLQKSKPERKHPLIFALIILIFIGVIFISLQIFAGSALERFTMSVGGPVATLYVSIKNKLSLIGAFSHSRIYLVEENRKLRTEIEKNNEKNFQYDSLLSEHTMLLSSYGRNLAIATGTRVVLGNVISKPPKNPYDVLHVDVGAQDGVTNESRVYTAGGLPVGRVVESGSRYSKIIMYSSVDESTSVILERTGETLDVTGRGGGNLEVDAPQEFDVIVGDKIILPEFNSAIVATVVEFESNPTGATKKILFKTPINIFNLRWVEIEKTNSNENLISDNENTF